MTNKQFISILRMMGWQVFGGGMMNPPIGKEAHYPILLISGENEVVMIGQSSKYHTCQEALDDIIEKSETETKTTKE